MTRRTEAEWERLKAEARRANAGMSTIITLPVSKKGPRKRQ